MPLVTILLFLFLGVMFLGIDAHIWIFFPVLFTVTSQMSISSFLYLYFPFYCYVFSA